MVLDLFGVGIDKKETLVVHGLKLETRPVTIGGMHQITHFAKGEGMEEDPVWNWEETIRGVEVGLEDDGKVFSNNG